MAKIENVSEASVQEFWTEHPMILPGLDLDSATPEQIFEFTEKNIRSKVPQLQNSDEPPLARYLDYEAYRGKSVLEIGFGVGWLINEFVKCGAEVHGIDLSKSHFELSSYRFRDRIVDLRVASAESIPFDDNSLDLVVAYGVLHHARDDELCYSEVHRVLKPNGRAFLMVYRKGGAKYYLQKLWKKGILRGGLFKHGFDTTKFFNSVTDAYSDDSPGAPISRYYTPTDLKYLFRKFSKMKYEITGTWDELSALPASKLPVSDWLLTRKLRYKLLERFGGFFIINLIK